jgi:hypothetical protein
MHIEAYIFLVFVVSSFMQTVTGFGYAIITAPLLAFVLGAKDTVMLVMLTGMILRLFLVYATRDKGNYSTILPIFAASVVGALPGAYLMTVISNDALKLLIGVVLILASAAMWKNYCVPVRHPKYTESVVGLISGFLATTTSINGPPIVLYYLNSKVDADKAVFRANLTRYFLLINGVAIMMSYFYGTLNLANLWFDTLLSIPALVIGFWLGEKLFYRIDAETFRRVSLVMVFVSSIAIIGSVLVKKFL